MNFREFYPDRASSALLLCRSGDAEGLARLISAGGNCKKPDSRGWTPMHEAAANGHHKCLEILIEHGK